MTKKVVIIGAGPGGYPAALKAASLGAEVTVIEKGKVGGVCLNCGCIPSKSLLDASHRFKDVLKLKDLSSNPASADELYKSYDFTKIQARRKAVIERLQRGILAMFKAAKINYIEGAQASFISPSEIKAGDNVYPFDAAIIAAGTKAFIPPQFAKHGNLIHDNSTIFNLERVPASLAIVGGGVIGCEFACIFNALGTKVTIIEMLPNIINMEDEASIRVLKSSFEKRGIEIKTGRAAQDVTLDGDIKNILLDDGTTVSAEEVLVAVGRTVDLAALNLEAAGIEYDRKGIKANPDTLKVKDNIYAVGDVNGLTMLAHAAHAQGEAAAKDIMGKHAKYNNDLIPKAIYTWPEVASIGLNKKEAEAKGIEVKLQKTFMLANGRALTQDETEGFVQIVSDAKTNKVIGAQIVGQSASEMIHIPQMAILNGMTTEQVEEFVFAHPTLSEAIKETAAR